MEGPQNSGGGWAKMMEEYGLTDDCIEKFTVKVPIGFDEEREWVTIIGAFAAYRCPYFRQLFTDTQKTLNKLGYDLIGNSARVFKIFLNFLYTDVLREKDSLSVQELRHLTDLDFMFQPHGNLRQLCEDALRESISIKTVFHICQTAFGYGFMDLHKTAYTFAIQNCRDVLASDGLYYADASTLFTYFASDDLECREVDLFKALVRWGQDKVDNQKFMRDTLKTLVGPHLVNIRFPLMTADEVATVVIPTGLLSREQLISIVVFFAKPTPEAGGDGILSTKPRKAGPANN